MSEMTATLAPPSAPRLGVTPPPAHEPVTDDIEDPSVPETVIEALKPEPAPHPAGDKARFHAQHALLVGFCEALLPMLRQALFDEHTRVSTGLSSTLFHTENAIKALSQQNEHSTYQLSNALAGLQERGITIAGSPYTARVRCCTPQGYGLELTVHKATAPDLIDELARLTVWLAAQGYTGVTPPF